MVSKIVAKKADEKSKEGLYGDLQKNYKNTLGRIQEIICKFAKFS